jgi:tetratricopeptide (TPR) repeat protein
MLAVNRNIVIAFSLIIPFFLIGCSLFKREDVVYKTDELEDTIYKIDELIQANKLVEAYNECEKALEKEPGNVDLRIRVLYCEYEIDVCTDRLRHVDRIEELKKEAENDPTGETDALLGYLFYLRHLPGLACEHFRVSEEKGYKERYLFLYHAVSLVESGEDEEAEKKFLEAIEKYPAYLTPYSALIRLYVRQERMDEAYALIDDADEYVKENRPSIIGDYLLAKYYCYTVAGDEVKMRNVLEREMTELPYIFKTDAFLSIYETEGKYSEAESILKEYTKENPQAPYGFYELGVLYSLYLEDFKRAEESFTTASELSEEEVYFNDTEAWPFIYKGDEFYDELAYDDAIKAYEGALEIRPDDGNILSQIGFCYLRKAGMEPGNEYEYLDKAADYFIWIIENCENPIPGYNGLGSAYLQNESYGLAVETCREGLEKDPYSKTLMNNLGLAYEYEGKREEAKGCFEKVTVMKPDDGFAHLRIGCIEYAEGNYKKSIINLKKAVKDETLEPVHNADAHRLLAAAYIYEELERVRKLHPYRTKISESTKEKALEAISAALRINPENALYADNYNWINEFETYKDNAKDANLCKK